MNRSMNTTLTEQERTQSYTIAREIGMIREATLKLIMNMEEHRRDSLETCSDEYFDRLSETIKRLKEATYAIDQAKYEMRA